MKVAKSKRKGSIALVVGISITFILSAAILMRGRADVSNVGSDVSSSSDAMTYGM